MIHFCLNEKPCAIALLVEVVVADSVEDGSGEPRLVRVKILRNTSLTEVYLRMFHMFLSYGLNLAFHTLLWMLFQLSFI